MIRFFTSHPTISNLFMILLLLVIAFIQWKPAGLFPPKGRLADD